MSEEDVMSACEADTHMAAAQATNAVEEVKPRRYGVWAGNKNGTPEDPARCIVEVVKYNNGWPSYSQCRRKRGHGQDGLYCAQHGRSAP